MRKEKILFSVCLILVITYISFYPSLENHFVNWDDPLMLTENRSMLNFCLRNIKKFFTSFHVTGLYHPLVDLSYLVESHFFRLTPLAYHTTNLILHLVNCLLVFWFIFLLSGKFTVSLPAALLFGLHPLHVESVAWVTERKDVLASIFFLGGLISYIFYIKKQNKNYYYITAFLLIFSLLSKALAIVFPFVLLLCDYILGMKFTKKSLKEKALFFIISFLFVLLAMYGLYLSNSFRQAPALPFYYYISFASYGLAFYLYKLVLPLRLSCFYPYPEDIESLSVLYLLTPPLIIAILTLVIVISKRWTKKLIFGSLFFLITILPVIQLLPSSKTIAADRYTYIPLIGLFYIIGEFFHFLFTKDFSSNRFFKKILLIILVVMFASLSFLTFKRCEVWKDSVTLWNDVLKKYPNLALAYSNRGNAYIYKDDYDRALSDYNTAVRLKPDHTTYANRGSAYSHKKDYDRAILDYNKAISINQDYVLAYHWRGLAYAEKKEYDQAISDYNKAISIKPGYLSAYVSRGNAYICKAEYDRAISDFSAVISIDPDYVRAYANRGSAYIHKKDYDRAISDYNKVLKIDPNYVLVYNWRGTAYANKGDYDRAISDYSRALELDPDYEKAYTNRGSAYRHKGAFAYAIYDYNKAIGINPDSSEAYNNRGNVYFAIKDYDQALSDYNKTIELDPDYAEAYNNRAVIYFEKKEYDSAWRDIQKAGDFGCKPEPEFLERLRKYSNR